MGIHFDDYFAAYGHLIAQGFVYRERYQKWFKGTVRAVIQRMPEEVAGKPFACDKVCLSAWCVG